jgi:S-adenosylmethionine hydrolase
MTRPIVFLTDYGLSDPWVGICHGVMYRIAPEAHVIDLTHAVPRQNVMRGAIELGRAVEYLPPDAVYLAVVDPGVGSSRRAADRLEVPSPMVAPGKVGARVMGVDGFGNVQLNATTGELASAGLDEERVLVVNGRRLPRAGTFGELPEHEPGMIVDSEGFIALVVNHGSAATTMRLSAGDTVVVERR